MTPPAGSQSSRRRPHCSAPASARCARARIVPTPPAAAAHGVPLDVGHDGQGRTRQSVGYKWIYHVCLGGGAGGGRGRNAVPIVRPPCCSCAPFERAFSVALAPRCPGPATGKMPRWRQRGMHAEPRACLPLPLPLESRQYAGKLQMRRHLAAQRHPQHRCAATAILSGSCTQSRIGRP